MSDVKIEGHCILCFLPNGNHFQGRIITGQNNKQYGLTGTKGANPDGHFHECCFEDAPKFFCVTLIDFDSKKEVKINYVMQNGGDNCSLIREGQFEFHTDQLFAGFKADNVIGKYFSDKLVGKDCLVCLGHCIIPGISRQWSESKDGQ